MTPTDQDPGPAPRSSFFGEIRQFLLESSQEAGWHRGRAVRVYLWSGLMKEPNLFNLQSQIKKKEREREKVGNLSLLDSVYTSGFCEGSCGGSEGPRRGCLFLHHLAVLSADKCLALRSLPLPLKNRPYHCRVLEKRFCYSLKRSFGESRAQAAWAAGMCSCNLACVKLWKGLFHIPALGARRGSLVSSQRLI